MGVAMLAVPLATRSYRHRSLPLPRSRPMAASAVKTTTLREPPASYTIGDEYAAQPLCDCHSSLPLILSRATTAAPGPPGVTTTRSPSTSGDDLVHAGVLGLFDAASKYNPDKKVVFQSYAKHRVKGAILDSLRQLDWASRDLRKRQKQLDAVTHNLMTRLGRTPTEAEIAETLGLGLDRWRRVALELKNLGLVSASSLRPDPDNSAPIEFPAAPDSQPDRICAQRQLSSVLAGAMKCLPERYQKVVFLYYTNEMTMKEIGQVLGVN